MMPTEQDYWANKYEESCLDIEASDVRYVMAHGAKITRDGSMWSVLVGSNIMEGIATFGETVHEAVKNMNYALRNTRAKETKRDEE